MLKTIQARLQQEVNHEFPDVQAGFRKGKGTRDLEVAVEQQTGSKLGKEHFKAVSCHSPYLTYVQSTL